MECAIPAITSSIQRRPDSFTVRLAACVVRSSAVRTLIAGSSYEHRKTWVEERLLALADCFAVGLYAYAVMSDCPPIALVLVGVPG